ncbi:MAG: DUF6387 family protein [Methylococcaceae bacterium]|nr:DUF6387 family protein [Methylococcaceae bacterium]
MDRSRAVENLNKAKEWFDIEHYKEINNFDLNDWYMHLSRRYWMLKILKHTDFDIKKIQNYNECDDLILNQQKKFLGYAELIKKSPIIKIASNNYSHVFKSEPVRYFSILDMEYWINDGWFEDACRCLDNKIEDTESDEEFDFLVKPVNEHLKDIFKGKEYTEQEQEQEKQDQEQQVYFNDAQEHAYLSIDLNTPDKILREKFKLWLKNHRRVESNKLKLKNFGESILRDWCDKTILPFLDLKLISEVEGQSLTLMQCAEMLDIEDYKTINKNAKFLMSMTGLNAIRNQLHQAE